MINDEPWRLSGALRFCNFIFATVLLSAAGTCAQQSSEPVPLREPQRATPGQKPSSVPQAAARTSAVEPSVSGEPAAPAQPQPGLKDLPLTILKDQKKLWLRALRPQAGDAPRLLGLGALTAGMLALDEPVAVPMTDDPPGRGYRFSNRVGQLSSGWVDFGIAGTFYLAGRWRGNQRAQATGLLGLRAVADTLLLVQTVKAITQRPRPANHFGLQQRKAEGKFFTGGNSFPSGHAAQAWALATVVAHQYREKRWVQVTAFGLAGVVSGARIGARKHFVSDVVVGSLLGYLIGRHVLRDSEKSLLAIAGWQVMPHPAPGGGAAVTLLWQR